MLVSGSYTACSVFLCTVKNAGRQVTWWGRVIYTLCRELRPFFLFALNLPPANSMWYSHSCFGRENEPSVSFYLFSLWLYRFLSKPSLNCHFSDWIVPVYLWIPLTAILCFLLFLVPFCEALPVLLHPFLDFGITVFYTDTIVFCFLFCFFLNNS